MTFHDYLLKNLQSTVMISLSVDNNEPCWFRRTQKMVTEPVIQWIYNPVVVYK